LVYQYHSQTGGKFTSWRHARTKISSHDFCVSAGITFEEYHIINQKIPKDKAHQLLLDTSAIFLTGDYTPLQNTFLTEYELHAPVKNSRATVIMGAKDGKIETFGDVCLISKSKLKKL